MTAAEDGVHFEGVVAELLLPPLRKVGDVFGVFSSLVPPPTLPEVVVLFPPPIPASEAEVAMVALSSWASLLRYTRSEQLPGSHACRLPFPPPYVSPPLGMEDLLASMY